MKRSLIIILLVGFSIAFVSQDARATTSAILKEETKNLRIEKKTAITKIKKETREMIQTRRDTFKARIQEIKDQRKKVLVKRIDAKIEQINKKTTDKFQAVLTRLQSILDKIDKNKTDAQSAIDAAKIAVVNQTEKVYTANITNEEALKLNVGATVSEFRQDLKEVHKTIVNAKQEVQKLNYGTK